VFDDAAVGLLGARKAGIAPDALLASAMAGGWLVNSATPSPTFQKWLAPPLRDAWVRLIGLVEGEGRAWSARTAAEREEIESLLGTLATDGGTLGAITKVLSLISLEPVPLMPDAAIAFVLRAVPIPEQPDAQTAPVRCFLPMMDRIAEAAAASDANEELAALADGYPKARLRPRDVVDRLLWFDSVGYRFFRGPTGGWFWVRDEAHEAVVFVAGAAPSLPIARCVELPAGDEDFSKRAAEALASAFAAD